MTPTHTYKTSIDFSFILEFKDKSHIVVIHVDTENAVYTSTGRLTRDGYMENTRLGIVSTPDVMFNMVEDNDATNREVCVM